MAASIIKAGQRLGVRWRDYKSQPLSQIYVNLRRMKLTPDDGGNPLAAAWATFMNSEGVSIYIVRGYEYGGDLEAFVPKDLALWQAYFEPYSETNLGYVRSKHFARRFPIDFL
jgi:hypothetical protein